MAKRLKSILVVLQRFVQELSDLSGLEIDGVEVGKDKVIIKFKSKPNFLNKGED